MSGEQQKIDAAAVANLQDLNQKSESHRVKLATDVTKTAADMENKAKVTEHAMKVKENAPKKGENQQ